MVCSELWGKNYAARASLRDGLLRKAGCLGTDDVNLLHERKPFSEP